MYKRGHFGDFPQRRPSRVVYIEVHMRPSLWFSLVFAASCTPDDRLQPLTGDVFGQGEAFLTPTVVVDQWAHLMQVHGNIGGLEYYNDPSTLDYDSRFVYQVDQLPMAGFVNPVPWTGSYWPENKGGIAYRWQTGEKHDFPLLSMEEAQAAPPEEIALLSPAEKYDLFVGATDWPLTHTVLAATGPNEASWTGYCHGWAPAAMTYNEPKPVTVTTESGIEISFGSSDIKALLTFFEGDVSQNPHYSESQGPWARDALQAGNNCASQSPSDPNCFDTNPAALHIVMANRIGLQGNAFLADVDPSPEKWNQPVHAYESRLLERRKPSPGANPEAIDELVIETTMAWTVEIEPQWETAAPPSHTRTLLYSLELDSNREIIGGQWLHQVENGGFVTYHQVLAALSGWDGNGDGTPDMSKTEISSWMRAAFDLIDAVWILRPGDFSDTFREAYSSYSFLSGGPTTNAHLFDYFAKLSDLYEASLNQ